jgi:hypothetical protein
VHDDDDAAASLLNLNVGEGFSAERMKGTLVPTCGQWGLGSGSVFHSMFFLPQISGALGKKRGKGK